MAWDGGLYMGESFSCQRTWLLEVEKPGECESKEGPVIV